MNICNIPDCFTREVKCIYLYKATSLSFNENLKKDVHFTDDYLHKIEVSSIGSYQRNIDIKKQNFNTFWNVDMIVPVYDSSIETLSNLFEIRAKPKYRIVVETNREHLFIGNVREPMSVDLSDKIKDNGKGKDCYHIHITGQTIIQPIIKRVLNPLFHVLFFTPMLERQTLSS